MEDRMRALQEVLAKGSTHTCPECKGPAYCAMEAGKSANLCWCMEVPKDTNPVVDADVHTCLCKSCLK